MLFSPLMTFEIKMLDHSARTLLSEEESNTIKRRKGGSLPSSRIQNVNHLKEEKVLVTRMKI